LEAAWQAGDRPFDFDQDNKARSDWQFTDAEMMTAVGHLETHGYVTVLMSSSGEAHILLAPDLLVNLASSIVLLADKHPRELGAVSETDLLQGRYAFEELEGLNEAERQVLLDAVVWRFLAHNVCFRETFGSDTLLIFPGLIKQKRPLVDDFPATDDVSYIVRGRVENLYAMLVVLLGYTPSFVRINQWQNQAQYEMGKGEICGFCMIADREGEIELVLYYSDQMPQSGRDQFQALFERFLYKREVEVTRFPAVACPEGHRMDRATVVRLTREGKSFAFCAECGQKVELPKLDQPGIGTSASDWLEREEGISRLRSTYEQYLTRVKGYRRGWATPRCYLSRAPGQTDCAADLVHDLQDAGVYIIAEASQVKSEDYVILLDTPDYQRAYHNPTPAFESDVELVRARLAEDKQHLISIKLDNEPVSVPQHDLDSCEPGDFCDPTHYSVSLFNLVLNLYAIPLTHAVFAPLRETLHKQWERMSGGDDLSKVPDFSEADTDQSNQVSPYHIHSNGGTMPGISRDLIQGLRKTLRNCGPFDNNSELNDLFFDGRISPWQDRIPTASSRISRINALINSLHTQYNTAGQNALALFLRVVSDLYEPTTACHQELVELATELESETDSTSTVEMSNKEVMEHYVDFDLHIGPDGHAIANSLEGQAITDISTEVPGNIRLSLKLIEKRAVDAELLKEVGKTLYDWLFPGPIHTHFHQTEAVARAQEVKIRLRLRIEAEEIAGLPLEFVYRETGGYFIAINPDTVLSRYLNRSIPPGYIRRREGPLHMLAIIADPTDQTRLPPDEWESIIKDALAGPLASGQMALQTVKRATRKAIRDALLQQKPDIIQFVGHGIYKSGTGYLALVDEDTDKTWLVDDERFANLYMGHDDHLGLISLATCESAKSDDPQGFLGIAPKLVQRGVPAVVAMQYKVLIKTAKIFLEDFYTAVAARKPIDWATQSARNAVSLELGFDNREFATPVLYMRAKDGEVF
jgi:hypothetical protein